MLRRSSPAFWLPALYAGICLVALAYLVMLVVLRPGEFELAGIAIVLLGLPWSILLTFAVILTGSSSAWLLGFAYIASCVFNGWLLHKLGARLASTRKKRRTEPNLR